jgi:poly-gamma-glutamate synthesis protein (capsule biosynthesis protein)
MPLVLAGPPQWATAVEAAIQDTDPAAAWHWEIILSETPGDELAKGSAQLALVLGTEGVPAGRRPQALVVPFTSDYENLSLSEAQAILEEGSPFIAVMDWADIPPTHKALLVDGLHPSDPAYPLQQSWSLIHAPEFEAAAQALSPALHSTLSHDPSVQLAAVGDIMLDRKLGDILLEGDLIYPFAEVAEYLREADLTIGNLESALGDLGTPVNKSYTFRAPPGTAQALAIAGFDLPSLANNHALDYGPLALEDAIHRLNVRGIAAVGAGTNDEIAHAPYLTQINGISLAIFAYVDVPVEVRGFDTRTWTATSDTAGMAWADPERMQTDIAAVRQQVDLVVVLLHSGYENVFEPSPPQRDAAHAAIDAGANLVLGHHAHVLQGVEFYNDGVIVYGLGNFAFEDGGPPESAILNVWLDQFGVRQLAFLPIMIESDGQPRLADAGEANDIRRKVYDLTDVLNRP